MTYERDSGNKTLVTTNGLLILEILENTVHTQQPPPHKQHTHHYPPIPTTHAYTLPSSPNLPPTVPWA